MHAFCNDAVNGLCLLHRSCCQIHASTEQCACGAGDLVWLDAWHNVLAPELRGAANKPATHVSIHLRQASPPHDVRCENAEQAAKLLRAVHRCLAALPRVRLLDAGAGEPGMEDAQTPAAAVRLQPALLPRALSLAIWAAF